MNNILSTLVKNLSPFRHSTGLDLVQDPQGRSSLPEIDRILPTSAPQPRTSSTIAMTEPNPGRMMLKDLLPSGITPTTISPGGRLAATVHLFQVTADKLDEVPLDGLAEDLLAKADLVMIEVPKVPLKERRKILPDDALAQLLQTRIACRIVLCTKSKLSERLSQMGDKRRSALVVDIADVEAELRLVAEHCVHDHRNATDQAQVYVFDAQNYPDARTHQLQSIYSQMSLLMLSGSITQSNPEVQDALMLHAPSFSRAAEVLYKTLRPLVGTELQTNDPNWVRAMRPVLIDVIKVAADVAEQAINPRNTEGLGEPSQVIGMLTQLGRSFSVLASDLERWLNAEPIAKVASRRSGKKGARTVASTKHAENRSLVSVPSRSGMHVLARVDPKTGRARTLDPENVEEFKKVGDAWVPWSPPEVEPVDDAVGTSPTLSARLLKKGEELLSAQGNVLDELALHPGIDPDIEMASYHAAFAHWKKTLESMERVALHIAQCQLENRALPEAYVGGDPSVMALDLQQRISTIRVALQEATAIKDRRYSLFKGYHLPQQTHWEKLFSAKEIAGVSLPVELPSDDPGTLFECRITPKPDASGEVHAPVYVHFHCKKSMTPEAVAKAPLSDFARVHIKSAEHRGRGAKWQQEQILLGSDDTLVHRSRVQEKLHKMIQKMMGRGV